MNKRCVTYILVLLLVSQVHAVLERDIFPEEDVKRFKSLTDFQLSPGTAEGQILWWDASNNKWIPSETPPASDEIVFWDDSGSAIMFLTPGAGVSITDTTLFFDADELDAVTWSDGVNASNIWTFDVSGTDHTMTAGNGLMSFSHTASAAKFALAIGSEIEDDGSGWTVFSGDGDPWGGLGIGVPQSAGSDFWYGYGGTESHFFGGGAELEIDGSGIIQSQLIVDIADANAFKVRAAAGNVALRVNTSASPLESTIYAKLILHDGALYAGPGESGELTISGTGGTNNENLTLDFEDTSNKVIIGTGTGVTDIDLSGINLIDVGTIQADRGLFGGVTDPLNPGSTCMGRWKFEDNLPTKVILDDVGDNDGEASENTENLNTTGKLGDAFTVTGENLTFIDTVEFDFTGAFSAVLWFKTSSNLDGIIFLAHYSGVSATSWQVRINDDAGSFAYALLTNSGWSTANSADEGDGHWADGEWHLMIATYDKSLGSERLKLYVDNVKVATDNGYNEDIKEASNRIVVGGAWIGEFDNFMLYDEALSEGEISALWNSGAGNEDAGFASITEATIIGSTDIFTFYHASDIGKDAGIEGDLEVHSNIYADGIFATYFGNYVGFDAPTLTSSTSWTLPSDDGAAGQVMKTNGSEILAWVGHDGLADFVAAEHIDWTSTSENFSTSGTLGAGAITGTSLTDGTATLDDGSLTSAVDGTFSGTVQAEQLTSTDDITAAGNAHLGNAVTDYHGINASPVSTTVLTMGDEGTNSAHTKGIDFGLRSTASGTVTLFDFVGIHAPTTFINPILIGASITVGLEGNPITGGSTVSSFNLAVAGAGTYGTAITSGTHTWRGTNINFGDAHDVNKPTGGTFNFKGLRVEEPPDNYDGATLNWYSLYLEDATANSPDSAHAIYSVGGQSVHGGNVKIGDLTAPTCALDVNGVVHGEAGFEVDNTILMTATVELSNADVNTLQASPKELVAAPGAGQLLEFVSAILILDQGTSVYTESTDNLAIEYDGGGDAAVSETIEATGFIDQAADTITRAIPVKDPIDAAADIVNKNLALVNTGDGEYGGNAEGDSTMTVIITYRVHDALGL